MATDCVWGESNKQHRHKSISRALTTCTIYPSSTFPPPISRHFDPPRLRSHIVLPPLTTAHKHNLSSRYSVYHQLLHDYASQKQTIAPTMPSSSTALVLALLPFVLAQSSSAPAGSVTASVTQAIPASTVSLSIDPNIPQTPLTTVPSFTIPYVGLHLLLSFC